MRPYLALLRLDKPIGIWLVFFPAAWAVALRGEDASLGPLILIMLLGSVLMRSAGCIINDLIDRQLDAQVERTKTRPLASGAIKPWQAITLLVLLLLASLALACLLPRECILLAFLTVPLVALYPLMKRITWWPQMFLGITFNLGVLFGWRATGYVLSPACFVLYAAAIFWTLGYDTIYAVQDMADDATVGIRSTARRIGLARLRLFTTACYGTMLALLLLTGLMLHVPFPYYIGLAATATQLLWQVRQLPCTPERAGAIFRSNQWAGLFLLLGLLASHGL